MKAAEIAALRLVEVHEERPGTLTLYIKRLERALRESVAQSERDRRIAREVRSLFQEARRR